MMRLLCARAIKFNLEVEGYAAGYGLTAQRKFLKGRRLRLSAILSDSAGCDDGRDERV
jgi:hypothetical protein